MSGSTQSAVSLSIIHLITRLDLGGSAENTLLTVIGLKERGYRVSLLCGPSDNPPSANEHKAREMGIPIIRWACFKRSINPVADATAFVKLFLYLRAHRCDILHTHTSKAGILGRFAGRAAGVRTIVHTPHGHIFYGYFSQWVTRFFVWLERIATRFTDATITLTGREKHDYLDRRIGTPDTIHPVFSGINLSPFRDTGYDRDSLRREAGLDPHHFVAGTIARLVPVKNHDLIVSAAGLVCAACPELRFLFIGGGELREHLQKRIHELGLESRILLQGWRTDIAACLALFDVFVMVSVNEGMGRAFVEAQAAGVPVIGSRVGGIPEVMQEGKTGFLVDAHDPKELAGVLSKLYNNKELVESMSAACRDWVYPRFGKNVMVDRIETIYLNLVKRTAP